MKRWLPLFVVLFVLFVLIGWRVKQKRADASALASSTLAQKNAPVPVTVATATVRDIVRKFEAVGQADAILEVHVAPQITGQLLFVQGRQGDQVHVGEVLARLDPAEVEANVRQQEANVAEAQYRLSQAQLTEAPTVVGVDTNIRQQSAMLTSSQANYKEQLTDLQSQIAAAHAAVVDAQGKLNSMNAALKSAQANYNQTAQNYNAEVATSKAAVTDAQGRITNAEAAKGVAQAQIDSANANVDEARTHYNREQTLYTGNAVPISNVQDAKTTLDVAISTVGVAQKELDAAEAQRQSQVAEKDSAQQQLDITITKGKADIESAQAAVNQAQANVDSAAAELKSATDEEKITLNKTNASAEAANDQVKVSQAALENAVANKAQKPAYVANLAALQATVTAAQGLLDSAKTQLTYTTLTSNVDGYITARFQDPGSLGTPGNPIFTIDVIKQVYITVTVPEEVERRIHLGMPVSVTFDALPHQAFVSTVSQVNPTADPQSRQFTVQTILNNPQGIVKPGMFARATITTERISNLLMVPREAIQQGEKGASVTLVDADNKAQKRPVKIGASDTDGIQVTSGLEPGDKVVTIAGVPIANGKSVKIVSGGSGAAGASTGAAAGGPVGTASGGDGSTAGGSAGMSGSSSGGGATGGYGSGAAGGSSSASGSGGQ